MIEFPPGMTEADLLLVPLRHREDALQEAWLAHLEGRNPRLAARAYGKRERAHEQRHPAFTDLGLPPHGADDPAE